MLEYHHSPLMEPSVMCFPELNSQLNGIILNYVKVFRATQNLEDGERKLYWHVDKYKCLLVYTASYSVIIEGSIFEDISSNSLQEYLISCLRLGNAGQVGIKLKMTSNFFFFADYGSAYSVFKFLVIYGRVHSYVLMYPTILKIVFRALVAT
jgi:hypothetical protein